MSIKALLVGLLVVLSVVLPTAHGSASCVECTLVVDLVQKIAVQEAQGSVKQALDYLCGNFNAPGESALKKICDGAAVLIAIPIQAALDKKEIPDTTCQTGTLAFLKMCTPDQFTCQLFPSPVHERVQHFSLSASQETSPLHTRSLLMSRTRAQLTMFSVLLGSKMTLPGGDIQHHRPLIDLDGDLFSPTPTLRGWHWRGRDCNDGDKTIYPGRAQNNYGPSVDHNCNGISGLDQTQRSYEEEFCGGPNAPRGTVVLGDSASAHFGIPPSYLMPDNQNKSMIYTNLTSFAEDEADWPQCSWSTGFANDTDCPPHDIPIKSIYQRMRERNLCNHRDYENIGVNGANSENVRPESDVEGTIMSLARNKTDAPVNLFYSLIGNDICGHDHSFDHMRKPAEFAQYVTASLQYLDTILPEGSAVLFMPLVDGRVLYNTLGHLQHPIGVPYSHLYDYLNCLQISPCWGWMNSNETVRNISTEHAEALSAVYPMLINSQKYNSFSMYMLEVNWDTLFAKWIAQGGNPVDLIEPTDGFHPSTTGSQLWAQEVWSEMQTKWPNLIGPVNPHNDEIRRLFGDQGGY